jgi:hypothetical protein
MGSASGLSRIAAIGLVILVLASAGAFVFGASWEPQRTWANLLVVSYGLLGLGLGGAVLLALFFVTGARWSDGIRPVAEGMAFLLPVGAAGMALVLIARPSLYPWTATSAEPASPFQAIWLSRPFFLARSFLYLGSWLGLSAVLVRASQRYTRQGPGRSDIAPVRISALFLVVFAVTCWLSSIDWIMSLEPKWGSTIFGIYQFSGMFLSTLAAFIVLAICCNSSLVGGKLTADQMHDLGTLLFSFSSFWMYIWFSQYLLIWYTNNPEETQYYLPRMQENWQLLFYANLVLNWGLPFVVLLFRPAKENAAILLGVAVVVLAGRVVDLDLQILPPVSGKLTAMGIWDFSLIPGMVALAVLIAVSRLGQPKGVRIRTAGDEIAR